MAERSQPPAVQHAALEPDGEFNIGFSQVLSQLVGDISAEEGSSLADKVVVRLERLQRQYFDAKLAEEEARVFEVSTLVLPLASTPADCPAPASPPSL